jgi:hypothetical protein
LQRLGKNRGFPDAFERCRTNGFRSLTIRLMIYQLCSLQLGSGLGFTKHCESQTILVSSKISHPVSGSWGTCCCFFDKNHNNGFQCKSPDSSLYGTLASRRFNIAAQASFATSQPPNWEVFPSRPSTVQTLESNYLS